MATEKPPLFVYDCSRLPTVCRFMSSDAFVRVLVGPVGSGKSSGGVCELFRRALQQRPGPDGIRRTRFAVIRNTYGQLRDTARKTFEQWIVPGLGIWREQEFTFNLKHGNTESEILFRALDRPEDVKKLLSLELTGAYVNEAREIPQDVFNVLQTRVGRYPSVKDGGATWFGIWMDTNPWHQGHWGYELFSQRRPEGFEVFEQPDGLSEAAENVENLPQGYYGRLCAGKDSEWVDEYVRGLYPKRDKGSVYGDLLAALEARGGVLEFSHPTDGVYITHDLGISDATAQWYWRLNGDGAVDLIDYYEATGKPISHFMDEADARGYKIVRYLLPHDARARTLVTGGSVLDQFLSRYGMAKVGIVPELSLADGIQASRWTLGLPMRIHSRCEPGLKMLKAYRYGWDEERKIYSRVPVHDFSSHGSDAFRYVACSFRAQADSIPRTRELPGPVSVNPEPLTFNALLKMRQGKMRRAR